MFLDLKIIIRMRIIFQTIYTKFHSNHRAETSNNRNGQLKQGTPEYFNLMTSTNWITNFCLKAV